MTKSANRKARKPRNAHSKKMLKNTAKVRNRSHKTGAKLRNNIAADTIRETYRVIDAPFDQFRGSQVPAALRAAAERNLAHGRELYEHSKSTVQAVLESWQKSFGAVGQNAVAINRRMIEVAGRNMDMGFDLAIGLTGARNLAEVMELQAAYWHKVAGPQTQSKTRAARRN
jgi:hypothetical protein